METKERIRNAFKATRALSIPDEEVKPVLRQLLKVFNRNWELIEAEDYRALVDGYFEFKENKDVLSERPSKRLNLEEQEGRVSSTHQEQIPASKDEGDVVLTAYGRGIRESSQSRFESTRGRRNESTSIMQVRDSIPSQISPRAINSSSERASYSPSSKQPMVGPGSSPLCRKTVATNYPNRKLVKPRTEQIVNLADAEPSAMVDPYNGSIDQMYSGSSFPIASSTLGEVKIVLNCKSAVGQPNFQIPDFNVVLKFLEDKYIKRHKLVVPGFSMKTLLKDLCEFYLELGKGSCDSSVSNKSSSKVRKVGNPFLGKRSSTRDSGNGNSDVDLKKDSNPSWFSDSCNLVKVQHGISRHDQKRSFCRLSDITKGAENVKISLVDEIGQEDLPKFTYMPHNVIYQNAYLHISLARIADVDCCSSCSGNCVLSSIPCACARETGGEFAYTQEGLLKEEFLRACVSTKRNPQQDCFVFCQDCPLERSKNEDLPEECKGHLVRKFIKECWRKCGCSMDCGNRVVQRGITCNLQVFFAHEGKGWGLRTLQNLPKGSFVCEYVGEILTNTELYERNIESSGSSIHTYPVTLDADWGSEKVLKDEEALCLDATFSGNVARFINHRCYDANLIDIPVEVETPDRHYYHLAFFTTREVSALEELTWDYGIDFLDHDHPIEAFQCHCGSAYCRDIKPKGT